MIESLNANDAKGKNMTRKKKKKKRIGVQENRRFVQFANGIIIGRRGTSSHKCIVNGVRGVRITELYVIAD